MKLTALAVVLLALGIVLGLAFRATVFEAEAKPPPPQQREDQITIFADWGSTTWDDAMIPAGGTYQWLTPGHFIALDPSNYSPNATFRFEIFLSGHAGATRCVQLEVYLPVGQGAEDKGEICHTGHVSSRLRSDSFTFSLPPGELQIGVEAMTTGAAGNPMSQGVVSAARIIVDWTEGGRGH